MSLDASILPLCLAAGTALAVLVIDLLVPRWPAPWTVAFVGALATLGSVVMVPARNEGVLCAVRFPARPGDPIAGMTVGGDCSYVFDGLARLGAGLLVALTLIVLLLVVPALKSAVAPAGETCFLLICSLTGGVALAGAGDLITLIVALETLTVPLYILVALYRRRAGQAAQAGVTFFVNSVVATAITLLGAALLYLGSGNVHLRGPATAVWQPTDSRLAPLLAAGIGLVLAGLAFKVAAVPLHAWAPTTYDGAPLPVAGYLSTASKLGGVLAILIVVREVQLSAAGPQAGPVLHTTGVTLAALAIASMVVGTLVALRQQRVVRLLAWSSVAQAGFILAPLGGIAVLPTIWHEPIDTLVRACLGYAAFFVFLEITAFAALVALRPPAGDGGFLDELRGAGRSAPWRSAAANVARNDTRGFFGALFDYSFMNYVTPKVVKIVYVIVTVLIALGWLVAVVAAFANSVWAGIGFLLFGWIIALVYLAIARITLEFYLAVVSISEKVNHYARRDGML
jgi:NADH-quinone oxidoreductase subunit N